MTANVLNAIVALSSFKNTNIGENGSNYDSRVSSSGENFEIYVKDLLTGSFYRGENDRNKAYKRHFSFIGSQNKAVDAIAKFGDAFEIMKIEQRSFARSSGKLALNNSPPKDVLYSNDKRIRSDVRLIDGGSWEKKDIFYVVGAISGHRVKRLLFVQGTCYAASSDTYKKIFQTVKEQIGGTVKESGLEFEETKELGRIRNADPLGITDFRMRGMWEIRNPFDVFKDIIRMDSDDEFICYAIMDEFKFLDLLSLRKAEEGDFFRDIGGNRLVSHDRVEIKDPNVPGNLKKAVLIKVAWS